MQFKETTLVVLVGMIATTILIALGKVPPEAWQWVATGGVLAKGAQGVADRWGGATNGFNKPASTLAPTQPGH